MIRYACMAGPASSLEAVRGALAEVSIFDPRRGDEGEWSCRVTIEANRQTVFSQSIFGHAPSQAVSLAVSVADDLLDQDMV